MLLHEIHVSSGWRTTGYLDRYVNHTQNYAEISAGDPSYDPQGGVVSFAAPAFAIPVENAALRLTDPSPELLQTVHRTDRVLFVAHPDMVGDPSYLERTGLKGMPRVDQELTVAPTSSTRTLVTVGHTASGFMIKTDYDARIDRVHRRVTEPRVRHASNIGQALQEATANGRIPELGYLPESIGVTLRLTGDDASVIYRELTPRPYIDEEKILVPACSLYAHDMRRPDDEPLNVQLAKANAPKGGELDYFLDGVVAKLIRARTAAVQEDGLLLEMHGQNTFYELDSDGKLGRVIYRDFQSTHVDLDIRSARGKAVEHLDRCLLGDDIDPDFRRKQHSYIYDHIIGDLLLKRLVTSFNQYFPQHSTEKVTSGIRRVFNEATSDEIKDLLPAQTYRVGNYGPNNKVAFVVSNEQPVFR